MLHYVSHGAGAGRGLGHCLYKYKTIIRTVQRAALSNAMVCYGASEEIFQVVNTDSHRGVKAHFLWHRGNFRSGVLRRYVSLAFTKHVCHLEKKITQNCICRYPFLSFFNIVINQLQNCEKY